ncbi:D-serine ammonia-lyase [Geosmithia morbida]|uniref:D-serine dehydratase n=1 Tax=Geosmithia morbida TaxID=1094350 RepID=A0A9P5D6D8_9HYPO|nr:D-serine ammonia-lyase [Geosmithia morbida]KAF4124655.1 D-serine ammonia-lyase [Geosmithia morbida]
MHHSPEHHESYVGKPVSQLPTPSFIISLPIVKRNIARLHCDVEKLGIGFRPHVKTLKTIEVTRMMLANGRYRSAVASTLAEIRGLLPLVQEGILDECLYGLPICPGYVPQLAELRRTIDISLMVDHEQQIDALEAFGADRPWDIFIKLDVGSRRAGVSTGSSRLAQLIQRADRSTAVSIQGIYCHAGHSYGGRSRDEAESTLGVEISRALGAAALLPADRELVVSVGATPTAHVIESMRSTVPANIKLELHAGNFVCNDLQQESTTLVAEGDLGTRVAMEICSTYPERNEALVNAGVIALSRETSGYDGFGRLAGKPTWLPVRLSQEHGILACSDTEARVEDEFKVGDRVLLYCNHACITAAAFSVYYVVDENDVVVDTWVPWKGW